MKCLLKSKINTHHSIADTNLHQSIHALLACLVTIIFGQHAIPMCLCCWRHLTLCLCCWHHLTRLSTLFNFCGRVYCKDNTNPLHMSNVCKRLDSTIASTKRWWCVCRATKSCAGQSSKHRPQTHLSNSSADIPSCLVA